MSPLEDDQQSLGLRFGAHKLVWALQYRLLGNRLATWCEMSPIWPFDKWWDGSELLAWWLNHKLDRGVWLALVLVILWDRVWERERDQESDSGRWPKQLRPILRLQAKETGWRLVPHWQSLLHIHKALSWKRDRRVPIHLIYTRSLKETFNSVWLV